MKFLLGLLLVVNSTIANAQDSTGTRDKLIVWGSSAALLVPIYSPRLGTDVQTYKDEWAKQDKVTHFIAAWMISSAAQDLGMKGWKAATWTCVLAGGYEAVQKYNGDRLIPSRYNIHGYASSKDMVANCGGAFGAWGFKSFVRKLRD